MRVYLIFFFNYYLLSKRQRENGQFLRHARIIYNRIYRACAFYFGQLSFGRMCDTLKWVCGKGHSYTNFGLLFTFLTLSPYHAHEARTMGLQYFWKWHHPAIFNITFGLRTRSFEINVNSAHVTKLEID